MRQSQGSVPVDGELINGDSLAPKTIHYSPVNQDQSDFFHQINPKDRNSLAKSILFSCSQCCGPLVPIADCHVCKKTSVRKCVRCNFENESINHEYCKNLVIFLKFSSIISKNSKGLEK